MRRCPMILAISASIALMVAPSHADEGMWMLNQIPQLARTLKAMGLHLTPQQIWDPRANTGLASAVPWLGGCSSSFVSPDGLIITNHHCAFGAIQTNSTPEHDYITDGFLAANRAEELPYPAGRVVVFRGYEDVTHAVASALKPGMKPIDRTNTIERREKELIAKCEADGPRCRVAEMFGGGEFFLFRQLELRDVRLVYAPPRSIGEYGGEVDNWVWPRHTGDYSFLRAYVGRDGRPADYSPDNVPYHPDRWLKIATVPLKEGDFTFILGYPGRTMRYRVAASVAEDTEFYYPQRIKLFKALIAILERETQRGKEVGIKLASELKGLYNALKNNEGMLVGLKKSDLVGRKHAEQQQLTAWIDADPARKSKYGDVLPAISAVVAARAAMHDRDLFLGWLSRPRASGLLAAAMIIEHWSEEKEKPDLERDLGYQARDEYGLRRRLTTMQRSLDPPSERATLTYILQRASQLPEAQRITAVDKAIAATGKNGDEAVAAVVAPLFTTRLADRKTRLEMFDMPHKDLLASGDPMIDFAAALRRDVRAMEEANRRREGEMITREPRLLEALAAWKGTILYPDANSTLRFTYATVKGYSPRDAVLYLPFTTLHGVIEKNTGVEPFACPPRLLAAAKLDDFGRYVDPTLHDVPSCFLTTNDITGGNSGSPVMNGNGELVGLAFDGNYEAIDSDFLFDPALARTIAVDMRYVLWCMDYVDKAHWIMRELGVQPHAQ
jgi:hypothetical protein